MKIALKKNILQANDSIALKNRKLLDSHKIKSFNVMASPGAGKTSVILSLARHLNGKKRIGVIEGDIASRIDTELLLSHGIPAVQINTGGNCHLESQMIRSVLPSLPLQEIDVLMIENVGNLVCPANFRLGTHENVVVASVPEGHDKPYKYPGMFAAADIIILNKIDLAGVFGFDVEYFSHGVRIVNPDVSLFTVSAKTGDGMDEVARRIGDN